MTEPQPTAAMDPQPVKGPGSTPMIAAAAGAGTLLVMLLFVLISVYSSVAASGERLTNPEIAAEKPKVATADHAEVAYCTPQFKEVLQRVLHSCGLSAQSGRRGCKPTDVKTFANISDDDFNALFTPLKDRGGVIMYDTGKSELDAGAKKLLEERWNERRGARYFFVVARASKSGTAAKNRALSHERANSVMFHIKSIADDPDLHKQVGTLWLGEEFAQLSTDYCSWPTSRPDKKCDEDAINRTAFVSWVDCRL